VNTTHRVTHTLAYYWQNARRIAVAYWRWALALTVLAIMLPVLVMAAAYLVVLPSGKYVLTDDAAVQRQHIGVGLVLGAGVDKQTGKPYKELRSRLDVAASALQHGDVQKLILSGDNRFKGYDEPTSMQNYLVDTYHIDPSKLQPDYAGRSTYESCDRARQVFGQRRLVLFSAGSHLPRAIYLCRHLGVEAYGYASHVEASNAARREALARVKAIYNIYIHGEPTVYGAKINL
jgi:vancomycin permeability regulator SanA